MDPDPVKEEAFSSSASAFYNRYWGAEGKRSQNSPEFFLSGADTIWDHFDSWYRTQKGGSLLDIGCGEAHFLYHTVSRYGFQRGVGVDVSPFVIRVAEKKYPSLELLPADAESLPFPDSSFDIIQSFAVLEHVLDVEKTLTEVARLLKPGGYFFCYTTDFNWLKQVIIAMFFWDRYFDPTSPHIRLLKRRSYLKLATKAGLKEVHYAWHRSYLGLMPQGMFHVVQKPGPAVC